MKRLTGRRPQVGDRVRMMGVMPNDPDPIPVGMEGTVRSVTPEELAIQQYDVDWDGPRSLFLLPGDPFAIIGRVVP